MSLPQPLYLLSETRTGLFVGIGPHNAAKALKNFIQMPQLFKAYLARNGKESGVSGCGTGPPSRLLAPLKYYSK